MEVTVRLFAILRERAGSSAVPLHLPDGARVADALTALGEITAGLECVLAVNREYAAPDVVLRAGDELALIPPVSGGGGPLDPAPVAHVRITEEPLSLDALAARVQDPRAGAVVTFTGQTRDVEYLDYEAYAEMAEQEIRGLVDLAIARHGLTGAAVEHRVGRVPLGQASVIVATSSGHRPEAFAAARELIDELKAKVPIWKSEEGDWVAGEVPPTT